MASLRKRYSADGERFVWVVDFRLHGKRHVKSTRTDDRAIARQALKDIEARIVGGRFGLDERDLHTDTLSSFAQDFLAYSKANKAHKTFRTDQDVFARFIEFLGGDVPLEDITQETVERFKIHRTQQGLKPNSVNVAVCGYKMVRAVEAT